MEEAPAPPADEAPAPEGEGGNFVDLGESTNWWVWALVAIGLFFAIDFVLLLIGARKRRRDGKSRATTKADVEGLTASVAAGGDYATPRARPGDSYDETDDELNTLQVRLEERRDELETGLTYLTELERRMQSDWVALEKAQASVLTEREELEAVHADITAREQALSDEAERIRAWSEELKGDQSRFAEESEHLRAAQDVEAQRVTELTNEIARLNQARASLDAVQATIDRDRAALAAERQSFEAERERLYAELEVDLIQRSEEKQRSERLHYELEALRADLSQRDAQLTSDQVAIEDAVAALDEERAALESEHQEPVAEREQSPAEAEQSRDTTAGVESITPGATESTESIDENKATEENVSIVATAGPVTETEREAKEHSTQSHSGDEEQTEVVLVAESASAEVPPATDQAWGALSDEERAAFEEAALVLGEGSNTERATARGVAVVSNADRVTETRRTKRRFWPTRSGRNKKSGTAPVTNATGEAAPASGQAWGSLSDDERAAFEAAALELDLK